MYEKTNYYCFTMQRYDERLNGQNPFNESTHIFSKPTYLYFVSNQQSTFGVIMASF